LIPVYFQILSSQIFTSGTKENKELIEKFNQLVTTLEPVIKKGQISGEINPDADSGVLIRTLVSSIDGIALHYSLFQYDNEFFNAQINEVKRMILSTLQAHRLKQ